jgi:hypothetical protein
VEGSAADFDDTFDVSDSTDGAYGEPANEGTNVCVAALSTMLGGNTRAVRDLTGFSVVPLPGFEPGFPP